MPLELWTLCPLSLGKETEIGVGTLRSFGSGLIQAPQGDLITSNLFWLSGALAALLSQGRGKPRVDDNRGLNGVISINRNGLHWYDVPREYGP